MSILRSAKKIPALASAALLTLLGAACSSSQEDLEALETEAEEVAEATATPTESAPEEVTAEVMEPIDEAATLASLGSMGENASAAATPASPPPAATTVEHTRVVRYINVDETTVHDQPVDSAQPVGKLLKGDRVLVVEENGWGRIADGMFVKLDHLSNRAVPHLRQPATWHTPGTPAH